MAEFKKFETTTNAIKNSVVDDKLKPTAEMHILIGGPYTSSGGEIHRYGHTALRIKTIKSDLTYDFGRYGKTSGLFGESGEGILRVWNAFNSYISGEVLLKRKTTSFVYAIFEHQANAANGYYNELIKSAKHRTDLERRGRLALIYQLKTDYHALGPNCTTLSVDGAKYAIPNIDSGSEKFIKPDAVLTSSEQFAVKVKGGASRIFLPANLESFLNTKTPIKPIRVEIYGSGE
jgi:hypothetical protein